MSLCIASISYLGQLGFIATQDWIQSFVTNTNSWDVISQFLTFYPQWTINKLGLGQIWQHEVQWYAFVAQWLHPSIQAEVQQITVCNESKEKGAKVTQSSSSLELKRYNRCRISIGARNINIQDSSGYNNDSIIKLTDTHTLAWLTILMMKAIIHYCSYHSTKQQMFDGR